MGYTSEIAARLALGAPADAGTHPPPSRHRQQTVKSTNCIFAFYLGLFTVFCSCVYTECLASPQSSCPDMIELFQVRLPLLLHVAAS